MLKHGMAAIGAAFVLLCAAVFAQPAIAAEDFSKPAATNEESTTSAPTTSVGGFLSDVVVKGFIPDRQTQSAVQNVIPANVTTATVDLHGPAPDIKLLNDTAAQTTEGQTAQVTAASPAPSAPSPAAGGLIFSSDLASPEEKAPPTPAPSATQQTLQSGETPAQPANITTGEATPQQTEPAKSEQPVNLDTVKETPVESANIEKKGRVRATAEPGKAANARMASSTPTNMAKSETQAREEEKPTDTPAGDESQAEVTISGKIISLEHGENNELRLKFRSTNGEDVEAVVEPREGLHVPSAGSDAEITGHVTAINGKQHRLLVTEIKRTGAGSSSENAPRRSARSSRRSGYSPTMRQGPFIPPPMFGYPPPSYPMRPW